MSSSNQNNKTSSPRTQPKASTKNPEQLELAEAMATPLFSDPVKALAKPSAARNAGPSTISSATLLFPSSTQLLKDLKKDFKKHLDYCKELAKLISDQKKAYEEQLKAEAKWEDETKLDKKTEDVKEVARDEPEDLESLDPSSQALFKAVLEEKKKLEEARKNEKNLESENK